MSLNSNTAITLTKKYLCFHFLCIGGISLFNQALILKFNHSRGDLPIWFLSLCLFIAFGLFTSTLTCTTRQQTHGVIIQIKIKGIYIYNNISLFQKFLISCNLTYNVTFGFSHHPIFTWTNLQCGVVVVAKEDLVRRMTSEETRGKHQYLTVKL